MSVWENIFLLDMSEIENINLAKLNCKIQHIADDFLKEEYTINEIFLIIEAIKNKTMLNKENALMFYKTNYSDALKAEGIFCFDVDRLNKEATNAKE